MVNALGRCGGLQRPFLPGERPMPPLAPWALHWFTALGHGTALGHYIGSLHWFTDWVTGLSHCAGSLHWVTVLSHWAPSCLSLHQGETSPEGPFNSFPLAAIRSQVL